MSQIPGGLLSGATNAFEEDDDDLLLPGEVAFARAQALLATVKPKTHVTSTPARRAVLGSRDWSNHSKVPAESGAIPQSSMSEQLELYTGNGQSDRAPSSSNVERQGLVPRESKRFTNSTTDSVQLQNLDAKFCEVAGSMAQGDTSVINSYNIASKQCFKAQSNLIETSGSESWMGNESASRELDHLRAAALYDEQNTWKLLELLHMPVESPREMDEQFEEEPVTHAKTEQLALNVSYRRNEQQIQLFHRMLIWLHDIAQEESQLSRDGSPNQLQWARTCKVLNGRAVWPHQSSYVSKLDPDAPEREGSCLHPEDEDDEVKFLHELWKLVRCGACCPRVLCTIENNRQQGGGLNTTELEQNVEQLCFAFGQPWRSASVMGGKLVACKPEQDPNEFSRDGNVFRILWKEVCAKLSHKAKGYVNGDIGLLESTIYGLLAGDLETVLQSDLCHSWMDHCWAYCRLAFEARVDHVGIMNHERSLEMTPEIPGPKDGDVSQSNHTQRIRPLLETSINDIFEQLRTSPDDGVRTTSHEFFPTVQMCLVEGRFSSLLVESICPYLCGPQWRLLGQALVESICGSTYLGDYGVESDFRFLGYSKALDEDVEAILSSPPPCWRESNSSAVAPLLLRFTTHLAQYLQTCQPNNPVVNEEESCDPVAVTACVAAYALHLGSEHNVSVLVNTLERTSPALRQAVVSGALEAAALADSGSRSAMVDIVASSFQDTAEFQRLLIQVVRNGIRHWEEYSGEKPSPFLLKAARVTDDDVLREGALSCPEGVELEEWLTLYELVENWRWLLGAQCTLCSAVVFANTIVRKLVMVHESKRKSGLGAAEWAAIGLLLEHAPTTLPEDETDAECCQTRDDALRELESWKVYYSAWEAMQSWSEVMELFGQQAQNGGGKSMDQLAHDLSNAAEECVRKFLEVFQFVGGWLCDADSPSNCNDPEALREFELRQLQIGTDVQNPGELKRMCIPVMIATYHAVLFSTGEALASLVPRGVVVREEDSEVLKFATGLISQSMQVANLVANEEDSCLYMCCTKEQLRELLSSICQSQIALVQLEQQHQL